MATRLLVARTVRRSAPVIGFGLTSSALLVAHNQRPTRFDHISASAPLTQEYSTKRPERKDYLDTEIIRQLSGGSVSGTSPLSLPYSNHYSGALTLVNRLHHRPPSLNLLQDLSPPSRHLTRHTSSKFRSFSGLKTNTYFEKQLSYRQ